MKIFVNKRYIGRSWGNRMPNDYFTSGFDKINLKNFIKKLKINQMELNMIKNIYYFCVDELTNSKKRWKNKNLVNKNNSKEFAIASILKVKKFEFDLFPNLKFNEKLLKKTMLKIKKIPKEELEFIKKFK